jgi:hypothetical protein
MVHSVTVAWDQLIKAFANMEQDRAYFLDRMTGEIFSIGSDLDDSVWDQIENQQERFLAIPPLDRATERQILTGFLSDQKDQELRGLLEHALSGRPPYANPADILSFFPEQEDRLFELRDSFVSNRVMTWLEENNLFSLSTSLSAVN